MPSDTFTDAIAIRDHLLVTLSPDAAKRCLTQINACCNWAVAEGLIEDNPFQAMKIKVPKGMTADRDINPFKKQERDQIIDAFSTDPYYVHCPDYVRFLFFTGARPNEVIGLQWKHITEQSIRFEQGVVISEDGLVLKAGLKTQAKRSRSPDSGRPARVLSP